MSWLPPRTAPAAAIALTHCTNFAAFKVVFSGVLRITREPVRKRRHARRGFIAARSKRLEETKFKRRATNRHPQAWT